MSAKKLINRKKYTLEYAGIDKDMAKASAKRWKREGWDVHEETAPDRFGDIYGVWVHKGKTAKIRSATYPYRVISNKGK